MSSAVFQGQSGSKSMLLFLALAVSPATMAEQASHEPSWNVAAPPGQARTASIETTTGTWMSLDVSPDGRTIAFDLLGDIYLLPIEGGAARPLTSGLPWTIQPRFSPDGSKIAFTSDAGGGDNIWVMNADGSQARQVTREDFRLLNNAWWSPDGAWLAARKHFTTTRSLGAGEVWLYHVNGGTGVPVIERPTDSHQKEIGEPAFSPDGRYLYFSIDSTPGSTFQYGQDSNGQIFEIGRHDLWTATTESLVSGAGGAVRPTPSPDGRYLAFVRRIRAKSALFLKDLRSGATRLLYEDLDQDLQEVWSTHGAYPNMSWTPDSKSMVFWAGGKIRRLAIEDLRLTDIDFHVRDTRQFHEVTRPVVEVAPPSFQARMVRSGETSPDGSRVVFEVAGLLYTKALPGGEPQRLTREARGHFEYYPSWSRDGRNIVFVSWDDDELGHVHTVPARGGSSRRVTQDAGHYHAPKYSPDGSIIVFEKRKGGGLASPDASLETGVLAVPSAGGTAKRITHQGESPQFGAANDRLYVTQREEPAKASALVSMDMNGAASKVHALGKYVTQYAVSPDERHFAFRENFHIYVAPLPPGGEPIEVGRDGKAIPIVKASTDGGNYPHWSRGGKRLHWSLGATLHEAEAGSLFDSPGRAIPSSTVSLAVQLESDIPAGSVAIVGGRVVTMSRQDGGVIDDGVILIDRNRIRAVGPRAEVAIPLGARVVDVSGKTVIPGLIDAHAHLPRGNHLIPQQNWSAHATLAFGVTTIHDPSSESTEIFAAAEMQRSGRILAPRIFSSGNAVYGAHSVYFTDIDSLEDAREHVARLKAQGAVSIKNYNQPRREQRQQVTTAAREAGLQVASESGSLFHTSLSMIADGNSSIEHNLPQSMLYDDVLQFWSQTRVAYTPTFVVNVGGLRAEQYWYQETEVWKHPLLSRFVPPDVLRPKSVRRLKAPESDFSFFGSARQAKALAGRGIIVSIGGHGQREGLGAHWEIWGFSQGGMSPVEALWCATVNPAKALGFDRDLGSIEAGKLADLVIIDADVLANIFESDRVSMVMLNGRLYEAATLNEVVTGNHRTAPFYWQ